MGSLTFHQRLQEVVQLFSSGQSWKDRRRDGEDVLETENSVKTLLELE